MIIDGDLFNISGRIKEVDETYKINFNQKTNKFELFGGKDNERLLVFAYDRLDCRAVEHARKTRTERMDLIIEEVDRANAQIEERALKDAKRQASENLYAVAEKLKCLK
ncbi:MAG: hypothetical protein FWD49_06665 [Firmicutes bacterium]|nr:hypothetical protein [Bacillota bacterium]